MDDKKSNVIYFQSRKASESHAKHDLISESKKGLRINHVADACSKSGHYSRVPNCIYEMGLSSQEREVWLYFNRLPSWEHPRVDEIHKAVGIRKATVLAGIERLCELNMLVVEGEGKNRRFHIPHPIYWKHELPKSQYAVDAADETPPDITSGVFKGTVKKRSIRNVPGGTKKNVPGGTKKRSRGNEKEPENVPGGTKKSQQTGSGSGVDGCRKTSFQDLTKLLNNPTEVGQMNLPGDGGRKGITLAEVEGAMLGLYHRYTSPKVITALIKAMLRKRTAQEILDLIENERRNQVALFEWAHTHTDIWLSKLNSLPAGGMMQ